MREQNITAERRTLGYLLRRPYEALSAEVYAGLAGHGFADIRPAHSAVFRHIRPQGSRITALADQAGITKQSMAYLVESLVAGGYVLVGPDPEDGRARLVRLTPRGRQVWDVLLALSATAEAGMAERIGQKRMAKLRRLLEELADALEAPGG